MTRRTRFGLAALAILVIGALGWGTGVLGGGGPAGAPTPPSHPRPIDPGLVDALGKARARLPAGPFTFGDDDDAQVTISGTVVDALSGQPVPSVEVVFRSAAGEETITAGADGRYRIRLAPGSYRAFVRDDTVLSVGRPEIVRLPTLPTAEVAGVPDEGLMPLVVATKDADSVDLSVTRGGVVNGRVVDRQGAPVAGAVVRARGGLRPTLGTDLAETDAAGRFELRLPAGGYELDATHRRYAGAASGTEVAVGPGDHVTAEVTMTAGCVISGRVIDPAGKASGDGAIERQFGTTDREFSPSGRIEADGTFRWVTTEETEVTLRAWPWKSPPSAARAFPCRDGARFDNVVFQLPQQQPDIAGTLVDEHGAPVAFAFIDLAPLAPDGVGQQERTDAEGRWQVYKMPPGDYRITASAPQHGVAVSTVHAPAKDVTLQLGGVGRIEGTTALLANGTFELAAAACTLASDNGNVASIALPQQHRLVQVVGGRFTIDEVPACAFVGLATWRGKNVRFDVDVTANSTASIELAIGPPHPKVVHGTVHDDAGRPVAGARIVAMVEGSDAQVEAISDDAGRFTVATVSGAYLYAHDDHRHGTAEVGRANVREEQVDILVEVSVEDEPMMPDSEGAPIED